MPREQDTLERRRLRAAEDAPPADDARMTVDTDVKERWHSVRKQDRTWQRVKLYDIGEPGWLYRWLYPRDPAKARRRVGHLYWKTFKNFILATNLLFFGLVFTALGLGCVHVCSETDRGWALLLIGGLMLCPGVYSCTILFRYVSCYRDYTWKILPEPA
eukprot:TRINITY_DN3328_c2_g2_i1.p1 TRINITY_DN3328_c2_g2~~TRINITY_DN3328_c2_g2_i1.p1  ORF type:complete len:159 (+),score=46.69 TRINITY_DN3328_c2_g2_i1:51-527(+)